MLVGICSSAVYHATLLKSRDDFESSNCGVPTINEKSDYTYLVVLIIENPSSENSLAEALLWFREKYSHFFSMQEPTLCCDID